MPPKKHTWSTWLPVVSLLIPILGFVIKIAVTQAEGLQRVAVLERRADDQQKMLEALDARLDADEISEASRKR